MKTELRKMREALRPEAGVMLLYTKNEGSEEGPFYLKGHEGITRTKTEWEEDPDYSRNQKIYLGDVWLGV